MLSYAAIAPNSPLLLEAKQRHLFPETLKGFKKIADDLRKQECRHILSVTTSHKTHSPYLTAYLHPEYKINFADFGDLLTKIPLPISWDSAHHLQDTLTSTPLAPIDQEEIDYHHGLPLTYLHQAFDAQFKPSYLCLNLPTASSAPAEISKAFIESIQSFPSKIALLISGSLYTTTKGGLSKDVESLNQQLRTELLNGSIPLETANNELIAPPSIVESLRFFQESFPIKLTEYSYEKTIQTSFLIANLNL